MTSTYFAEGFPYAIVNNLADVLFVAKKATLEQVGLTSLFHLPWNLKAFVGPLLDAYETKRRWLVGIELALSLALLVFALSTTASSVIAAAQTGLHFGTRRSYGHALICDALYLGLENTIQLYLRELN